MTWPNQATCRRCGRRMRTVAEIAPIGRDPGLAAFHCTYCGAADSVLIYPNNEAWEVARSNITEGSRAAR